MRDSSFNFFNFPSFPGSYACADLREILDFFLTQMSDGWGRRFFFQRHVRKARARASADTKVLTVTEHRNMNSKARNSSFPDALFAQVVDYFFCIYWNTQISQPNVVCIQYPQSNAVKTVWTKGVNLYEIDANNTFWQALQNIRKTKKPCTRSLLPLLSASEVLEICHKTYKGESK